MKKSIFGILFLLSLVSSKVHAQWNLTGNSGTNPANNFVGTTDSKSLKIRTNNQDRITITSGGKVGIGITSPGFKLDIKGNLNLSKDSALYIDHKKVFHTKGTTNLFVGSQCGSSIGAGASNSGFGEAALKLNTTGNNNSAFGLDALYTNSTGSANVAIGHSAMYSNSDGFNNIAIGISALSASVSGSGNTVIGVAALVNQTSGTSNVVVGTNTGMSLSAGIGNTFLGYQQATGVTASYYNTILGYTSTMADNLFGATAIGANSFAGQSNSLILGDTTNIKVGIGTGFPQFRLDVKSGSINTDSSYRINGNKVLDVNAGANTLVGFTTNQTISGSGNTLTGFQAGASLVGGNENAFFGTSSGMSNTGGSNNTFMGSFSGGNNSSGSLNTYLGFSAGNLSIGNSNTIVGGNAGTTISTGNGNTLLGSNSNLRSGTLSNASAIGTGALVGQNNSMVLGDTSNIQVGIGTSIPSARLHVDYNSTGTSPHLLLREQGADYARIHFQNSTTSNYWAIGALANTTGSAARINFFNNAFGDVMVLTGDGKVGIGNIVPAFQLEVATNSAAKPGSSAWTVTSDARLKKNVSDFKDGLAVLEKIHPVWFQYNGKAHMPTEESYIGTLAQDLQKAAPYMVKPFEYSDAKTGEKSSYLSVDYGAMDFILTNSVIELKNTLNEKQEQIDKQKEQIETLLNTVNQMQSDVSHCCQKTPSGNNLKEAHSIKVLATLYQNNPNPFRERTSIRCYIPSGTKEASILLFSLDGTQIKSIPVTSEGNTQVTLESGMLASGIYTYILVVDGQTIDTKQLILTK